MYSFHFQVIALGVILHRGSYLRGFFNIVDFIVTVTSLVPILEFVNRSGGLGSPRRYSYIPTSSDVKEKFRHSSGTLWRISLQSAAWVEPNGGFLIKIGSAEPELPHWLFRALRKFFYRISIIRAIGRRGPGSDKTTRISVTNEWIFTGQRPLCSLSCTLYL